MADILKMVVMATRGQCQDASNPENDSYGVYYIVESVMLVSQSARFYSNLSLIRCLSCYATDAET